MQFRFVFKDGCCEMHWRMGGFLRCETFDNHPSYPQPISNPANLAYVLMREEADRKGYEGGTFWVPETDGQGQWRTAKGDPVYEGVRG